MHRTISDPNPNPNVLARQPFSLKVRYPIESDNSLLAQQSDALLSVTVCHTRQALTLVFSFACYFRQFVYVCQAPLVLSQGMLWHHTNCLIIIISSSSSSSSTVVVVVRKQYNNDNHYRDHYCTYHVLIIQKVNYTRRPFRHRHGIWRITNQSQKTEGSTLFHRVKCIADNIKHESSKPNCRKIYVYIDIMLNRQQSTTDN